MTGLVGKIQAVVLVVLVVGEVEAVRDDSEGSTPLCLAHTPGLALLAPALGGRSPRIAWTE